MRKNKSIILFLYGTVLFSVTAFGQGQWNRKADLPLERSDAVSLSCGNKGYVFTGISSDKIKNDVWEYNSETNIWIVRDSLPSNKRRGAFGFSISNKCFIGGGFNPLEIKPDSVIRNPFNDFWSFNTDSNSWTKLANLPRGKTWNSIGFSIGEKGYMGYGVVDTIGGNVVFFEYNPKVNLWKEISPIPDSTRIGAVTFTIGNYGYVGTGYGLTDISKKFWKYDSTSNNWTSIASIDTGVYGAVGFSIGNKGYLFGGIYDDGRINRNLYEYDPNINTWTKKTVFPRNGKAFGIGFGLLNAGYVGSGIDSDYVYNKELWQYKTIGLGIKDSEKLILDYILYPNPSDGKITIETNHKIDKIEIVNILGNTIYTANMGANELKIELSLILKTGIYFVKMISGETTLIKRMEVIN